MNKQIVIIIAIILVAVIIIVAIRASSSRREQEIELQKQRTGIMGNVYGQQGDTSAGIGYLGGTLISGIGGLFKKKDDAENTNEAAKDLESAVNTSAMLINPTNEDFINATA